MLAGCSHDSRGPSMVRGRVKECHYTTSTIASTTYINPLEKDEGGGIEFFFHQNHLITILPEPNHIYFFPSWVLHRPLPQNTDKDRICINWGVESSKRPIHKLTGDRW
jgi:hypothetical protein